MNNLTAIKKIHTVLASLENTAHQLDASNSKLKAHRLLKDSPLFSIELFNTHSDLFFDYVLEVKSN